MYSHGGLFEGGGGFSLACSWAGFVPRWQLEINTYCQSVLANHWPDVTRYGNVFDYHNLPYVDLLTAGFPCQPFSVAGSGLGAKDERYLVPEMMRVIEEVQPRAVLLENVPRFATLNNGDELKRLLGAFAALRYDAEWGYIRAYDVGSPQERKRWFLVAYAQRQRRQSAQAGKSVFNQQWHHSAYQQGRQSISYAPQSSSGLLGEQYQFGTESRLDSESDGLPARMGVCRWPAGQGKFQHEWELPRQVLADRRPTWRKEAAVYGNAIIPQVVYPLALAVFDWLQAQDALSSTELKIG